MNMMRPLSNNIIVLGDENEKETKSGIILGSHTDQKNDRGVVKAIGPSVVDIKVGDRVMFSTYAPERVDIDDVEYLLLEEGDIMCVYEEE